MGKQAGTHVTQRTSPIRVQPRHPLTRWPSAKEDRTNTRESQTPHARQCSSRLQFRQLPGTSSQPPCGPLAKFPQRRTQQPAPEEHLLQCEELQCHRKGTPPRSRLYLILGDHISPATGQTCRYSIRANTPRHAQPPPVVEASLAVTFSEIGVRKSM